MNYLPFFFGAASLFGGIYLFLFSFKIYKPKFKSEADKDRYILQNEKYGTLMKICSIGLIINGIYNFSNINSKSSNSWSIEDKQVLVNKCLTDAGQTTQNYPEYTQEYCECSIDKIMNSMTKDEYLDVGNKSIYEQDNKLMPLIQNCLDKLSKAIENSNSIN